MHPSQYLTEILLINRFIKIKVDFDICIIYIKIIILILQAKDAINQHKNSDEEHANII